MKSPVPERSRRVIGFSGKRQIEFLSQMRNQFTNKLPNMKSKRPEEFSQPKRTVLYRVPLRWLTFLCSPEELQLQLPSPHLPVDLLFAGMRKRNNEERT